MNKKVFSSVFVSLLIFLMGVSLVLGLNSIDKPASHYVLTGTNFTIRVSTTTANVTHGPYNVTMFYGNITPAGTNWYQAEIYVAGGNTSYSVPYVLGNTTVSQSAWKFFWNVSNNLRTGSGTANSSETTDGGIGLSLVAKWGWLGVANRSYTNTSIITNISIDSTGATVTLGNITSTDITYTNHGSYYGLNFLDSVLLFNYTATEPHGHNCTVYHNLSGSWTANQTLALNTSINGTAVRTTALPSGMGLGSGHYVWGVQCRDAAMNTDGAYTPNIGEATNVTFYIDPILPSFDKNYLFKGKKNSAVWVEDTDVKDDSTILAKLIDEIYATELGETLTVHCAAKDNATNLLEVKYFIKFPGMNTFKEISTTSCPKGSTKQADLKECKLTTSDLYKTGTYYIYCKAMDSAGNTDTSSSEKDAFAFLVQAEEEGEITAAYVKAFNVDFSKVSEKILAEPEGRILSVSFDGITEHTITFDKVSSEEVTLIIKSDPITITLKKDETKNVDINKDGTDDFSLTYKGFVMGNAQVEFKSLEGAKIVAREETPTPTTIPVVTPEPTVGIGIWIVLGIVAVGLVIYFVLVKRKKK